MRLYILFLCFIILSCKQDTKQLNQIEYKGETMGTFYSVKFLTKDPLPQKQIDQKLIAINATFSTYIEDSQISLLNRPENTSWTMQGEEAQEFEEVFLIAKEIYKSTNGKFDPTVKPLVDYWGFGKDKRMRVHQKSEIDSLLRLVGFDKIDIERKGDEITITKSDSKMEIDFSAIAKGYGVDKIAELLEDKQVTNYMVEIGGETTCKGRNLQGDKWTLGVSEPRSGSSPSKIILKVQPGNFSMASSGNYRNFYSIKGKTYNHTIDPLSGMAIPSDLLAISVIAENCTTADAIATACIAMGKESSLNYIEDTANVEACFFYEKEGEIIVDYSTSFEQYIVN